LKPTGHKKVLGLAVGERSLLAAEMTAGEQPAVRQVLEFVYPPGLTTEDPAALGKALGHFLHEHHFTARAAIVGLPARWLVVKPKEVPPADAETLSEMLRLQAEGEFSSELKDLVYDYASAPDAADARTVLLVATPRRHVEAAATMCEAARIQCVAVTASAVTLGEATARALPKGGAVLAVGPLGAELTLQGGGVATAIRHLRASAQEKPFVGELRRTLSMLPRTGASSELILWDGDGLDAASLGESLGVPVRSGNLPSLGVGTAGALSNGANLSNGSGAKYAPAVALALAGLEDRQPPVDFLHSRLAPKKRSRIPRWAVGVAALTIAVIVGGVYAYTDLQKQEKALDDRKAQLAGMKDSITAAQSFVSMVTFAQGWHADNPRYLACLRDITLAIPIDGRTYATSLTIREKPVDTSPNTSQSAKTNAQKDKANDANALVGVLSGKTSDQQRVQSVLDRLKRMPQMTDVKLGGTQDAGRAQEVQFSINFTYVPPAKKAP